MRTSAKHERENARSRHMKSNGRCDGLRDNNNDNDNNDDENNDEQQSNGSRWLKRKTLRQHCFQDGWRPTLQEAKWKK